MTCNCDNKCPTCGAPVKKCPHCGEPVYEEPAGTTPYYPYYPYYPCDVPYRITYTSDPNVDTNVAQPAPMGQTICVSNSKWCIE